MPLHFSYISPYVIDGHRNMSLYVAFFGLDISRICAKEKKKTNCYWWCCSICYGFKGPYESDNRNCNLDMWRRSPPISPFCYHSLEHASPKWQASVSSLFNWALGEKYVSCVSDRWRRHSTSWCRSPSLQSSMKRWYRPWNLLPVAWFSGEKDVRNPPILHVFCSLG